MHGLVFLLDKFRLFDHPDGTGRTFLRTDFAPFTVIIINGRRDGTADDAVRAIEPAVKTGHLIGLRRDAERRIDKGAQNAPRTGLACIPRTGLTMRFSAGEG